MAIRKRSLERFQKELTLRKEHLVKTLTASTSELIDGDHSFFADAVDQASAEEGKTIAVQLKNRGHQELVQIDAALRRIGLGTYAECVRCGAEISESRMKAFPFTTFCIDCKAELESEEGRFPGRY